VMDAAFPALNGDPTWGEGIMELMDAVDDYIPQPVREVDKPFLMPVEDVFSITGRGTVATGRIEQGVVNTGDTVEIVGIHTETNHTVVTGVEMFRKILDQGQAGDNVGCLLRGVKREEIERGQVLCKPGSITPHTQFKAEVYVLKKEEGGRHTPFFNGYRPQFYFRTTDVTGVANLPEGTEMVMPGDNVQMEIELIQPIAMDAGLRFAIREGGRTVGSGVVTEVSKDRPGGQAGPPVRSRPIRPWGRAPEPRGPPSARRKTHGNSPAEQDSNPPQGLRRVGHRDGCQGDRGDRHAHRRDGLRSRAAADGEEPLHGGPLALQGQGLPGALRDPDAQAADRHPPADAQDGRLAPAARPPARGRRHRDPAGVRLGRCPRSSPRSSG
jgi:hypothetical protein